MKYILIGIAVLIVIILMRKALRAQNPYCDDISDENRP
jgi:hypothetical protein